MSSESIALQVRETVSGLAEEAETQEAAGEAPAAKKKTMSALDRLKALKGGGSKKGDSSAALESAAPRPARPSSYVGSSS